MLRKLISFFTPARSQSRRAKKLIFIETNRIESLFLNREGGLLVDWDMAHTWVRKEYPAESDHVHALRAIAAAWLDRLQRDSKTDLHRWRHAEVEGLAPLDGGVSRRVAIAGDCGALLVGEAMSKITGRKSIDPLCLIGVATHEDYYTFIAPFYPDEGEFATSGGVYLNEGGAGLPLIVLPIEGNRQSLEATIAHELTHHALHHLDLPLWIEEGLTQMMEERVTGMSNFVLSPTLIERHQAHWDAESLTAFWSGESFSSADGESQELSYSLAQAIVRAQLADRSAEFIRFIRAAASDLTGELAARSELGQSLESLAGRLIDID